MVNLSTKLKTKKIPTLRFPGFLGEWEEKRLKDSGLNVIDGDRGNNYPNGDDFSYSGYCLFLNAGNVTKNGFSFNDNVFITEKKDNSLRKGKLKRFDVVLTTRGSVGHIAYYDDDIVFDNIRINSGMALIRNENKEIDTNYVYKFLSSPKIKNKILKISSGSAQPQLTVKDIDKLKFSFPSISEQQKIAGFLGAVDEWIENLRGQKESLAEYKKGMMQKIFAQEFRFKDDDGNDFGKWEKKRLNEIGKTYNGLTGKSGEDFGDGEPFITYKQIFDRSEINIQKFALVKIKSSENQNKVQFGDILFTTSSETPLEVGFSSVLLDSGASPYLNSFSFGFRPDSLKILDPYFARLFFRSTIFRREAVKLAQGSTRYNISKIGFMKIKILLPSFPEQQKIAEFLTSVDNLIESKQQQITQAELWKKGLMQGLFV